MFKLSYDLMPESRVKMFMKLFNKWYHFKKKWDYELETAPYPRDEAIVLGERNYVKSLKVFPKDPEKRTDDNTYFLEGKCFNFCSSEEVLIGETLAGKEFSAIIRSYNLL